MKKEVSFQSAEFKLAGHLYTPEDRANGAPAIVVSHPMTGVKEQTAGLYARLLAEAGFVTLAFDAAYWGESEGTPHLLEVPAQRIEDIKSAVSFLSTQEGIDPERIGVLGICASGGYVIPAVATDHRVKAVATVSGVCTGNLFRDGIGRVQGPEALQGMLAGCANARAAEARGEPAMLLPVHPDTGEQAKAMGQHTYDGWEYYRTPRGGHPNSENFFVFRSIENIAQFNAFDMVNIISPRPLLMIVGSEAETSYMAREAIEKAQEPKELFVINGATHVDLYDKPEFVTPTVDKLKSFFEANLARSTVKEEALA